MFKNMKIGMRLGLGFGVVLLLMIVLIYNNISSMALQDDKIAKIVNENNVKTALSSAMSENASRNLMFILGGIELIMGIGITFWVTRSITAPLNIALGNRLQKEMCPVMLNL